MKKIPMILLLLAPYAIVSIYYMASLDMTIGIYLYGFLIIFNFVYAFLLPKLGFSSKQILSWNLALKLSNIPVILLILLVTLIVMMVGGKNLANEAFNIVLVAIGICYILQLSSSMFGISGYICYYKEKRIETSQLLILSILQFIPIVALFSSIIGKHTLKHKNYIGDDDDE